MTAHTNFYENLKEAQFRLRGTVVVYDGTPCYVFAITDHMKDGIYRIYLDPIGRDPKLPRDFPQYDNFSPEASELGGYLDEWLKAHPQTPIMRKQMNSPLFNKYQPFPLGMCNETKVDGWGQVTWAGAMYFERQPQRRHEQGLTSSSVFTHVVQTGGKKDPPRDRLGTDIMSAAMRSCILAEHPSAQDCIDNLLDPKIENEAAAFSRYFAFARGPIEMLFLAYKSDIIGVLPKNNLEYVRLGARFQHCREVVEKLGVFKNIS